MPGNRALAFGVVGLQTALVALATIGTSGGTVRDAGPAFWGPLLVAVALGPLVVAIIQKRSSRALSSAHTRLQDFADASSDFFWETDASHRFVWFSERMPEVTGLDPATLLGRTRLQTADTGNEPEKWARHAEILDARLPFKSFDYSTTLASGEERTFRIAGKPRFDSAGEFLGYRGTGLNITESVRTQRSETRLLRAIDNLPDCIALYDQDDRLLTCNNAYKARYLQNPALSPHIGRTFEEIYTANLAEREPPASGHELPDVAERMQRHQRATSTPQFYESTDKRLHVVRDIRMHDGGIMVLTTDVSELTEMQAHFRTTDERLRDFLATAADWFWESDADGRFTMVSDRYFEAMGVSPDEVLGQHRSALPGRLEQVDTAEQLDDLMAAREPIRDMVYQRRTPTGALRYLRISGKPVFDEAGKFSGYRGTGTDVTRFELARAEARQLEARLRDALEFTTDGIALYDADDRLVIWNQRYVQHYMPGTAALRRAMSFAEVLALGAAGGTIPDAVDDDAVLRTRMARHERADGTPYRYLRADGIWIQIREFRTSENGVLLVIADVTEQLQAQELTRSLALPASVGRDEFLCTVLTALCNAAGMDGGVVALGRSHDDLRSRCAVVNGEQCAPGAFSVPREQWEQLRSGSVLHVQVPHENFTAVLRDRSERSEREAEVNASLVALRKADGSMQGVLALLGPCEEAPQEETSSLLVMVAERLGSEFERESALQALRRSERNLRAVMDHSPVHVVLKDLRGRYLQVNSKWRAFNQIEGEIEGLCAAELFDEQPWLAESDALDRQVLDSGLPQSTEVSRVRDGDTHIFLIERFPVLSETGTSIGMGLTAVDVTDIRGAEVRARSALELLQDAIDSMTDGFVLYDADDRLVLCNKRMTEMWGSVSTVFQSGASRAQTRSAVVEHGGVVRVEELLADTSKTGPHRFTLMELEGERWYEIRDYAADQGGTIVVTIDVTSRKRLERSMQSQQAELERQVAERTRALESAREALLRNERLATMGQLSATVSHELRNPLGTARNACHLLRRSVDDDSPSRRYVDIIEREISHCVEVMKALLETTRIRPPAKRAFNLHAMVGMLFEALATRGDVHMRNEIPDDLEIDADPSQMRQVLTNLLANAVEASSPGDTVSVRVADGAIEVCDQGVGIADADVERIFEPGYSKKSTGTGLGLWLSREIVREHGGDLSIARKPGDHDPETPQAGTRMRVELPADVLPTRGA